MFIIYLLDLQIILILAEIAYTMNKYYLDPDYRHDPPSVGDYCIRCQKSIKATSKAITVSVDWENIEVWEDKTGKEYIGQDCWLKITNVAK